MWHALDENRDSGTVPIMVLEYTTVATRKMLVYDVNLLLQVHTLAFLFESVYFMTVCTDSLHSRRHQTEGWSKQP